MTDAQIFEPDGRAIPYAVEGAGPAVVLIPGRGLNIEYLNALAHSVATEDFRVVRVGFRRPALEAGAVSMNDLAQDVVDLMDHLAIDHAWVGGHAFGGTVARTVALHHHDHVNGVLLLGAEGTDAAAADFAEVPERFRDGAVDGAVASMLRDAWRAPAPLAAGVPVLIIQGTDDAVTPVTNGGSLQASAPELVSIVRVEGGGHMFPVTHVGATSWAIEDYLDWD